MRFPYQVPEYPVWSPPPRRRAPPRDGWRTLPDALGEPGLPTVYARTGILLGLEACGLGPGDEVLLPAYHCAAMVTPVVAGGFLPRFYDVGEGLRADPETVLRAMTPRTRAVVAVHYFGFLADLRPLRELCDGRGAILVEDSTHAFWRRAGDPAPLGDVVVASPYKFFPSSEGGLLWVRRAGASPLPPLPPASLRSRLKDRYGLLERSWFSRRGRWLDPLLSLLVRLRYLGRPSPFDGAGGAPAGADERALMRLYGPERRAMTPLAARWRSLGDGDPETRRRNYEILRRSLEALPAASIPPLHEGVAPYTLPLLHRDAEKLAVRLRGAGVRFQRFGLPMWPSMEAREFPAAAGLARGGLQLPIHESIGERDLEIMRAALFAPPGAA
jgi:hypothetical protein